MNRLKKPCRFFLVGFDNQEIAERCMFNIQQTFPDNEFYVGTSYGQPYVVLKTQDSKSCVVSLINRAAYMWKVGFLAGAEANQKTVIFEPTDIEMEVRV